MSTVLGCVTSETRVPDTPLERGVPRHGKLFLTIDYSS